MNRINTWILLGYWIYFVMQIQEISKHGVEQKKPDCVYLKRVMETLIGASKDTNLLNTVESHDTFSICSIFSSLVFLSLFYHLKLRLHFSFVLSLTSFLSSSLPLKPFCPLQFPPSLSLSSCLGQNAVHDCFITYWHLLSARAARSLLCTYISLYFSVFYSLYPPTHTHSLSGILNSLLWQTVKPTHTI